MIAIALPFVLAHALATASPLAPPTAFFQRAEPHLDAGAEKLAAGDADGAIDSFREATPQNDNERAIVEYDVGSALLLRALGSAKADAGGNAKEPDAAALDDARSAFERAMGLADDKRLKSEAALAAGNVLAQKSELDDAIGMYRKALIADPKNDRAMKNLRRVLDAKRAQPPPPEQKGDGEDNENKDKKEDENKDKKDEKDSDKKENQDGGKKDASEDKESEDGKEKDKKPDPKDGSDDKKDQEAKKDQDKEAGKDGSSEDKKDPKNQKKAEARRLLDALRSRERPMTPLEMRGQKKQLPAHEGKDW